MKVIGSGPMTGNHKRGQRSSQTVEPADKEEDEDDDDEEEGEAEDEEKMKKKKKRKKNMRICKKLNLILISFVVLHSLV
jgi:TATA-binding protein-associated factor Taf7